MKSANQFVSIPQPGKLKTHYTVAAVAEQLGMCERWVKDRVKEGLLDGYRLGHKIVVSEESVLKLLEQRRISCPDLGRKVA
ncbi:MAG TPA: helix-turn-helix domain-containing protein [Candidatus Paceibacterota bacterium]|nr:helix-turn-helix domain-containing protein [Candidatus Paceibacterota bacterium]HSA02636.1 helix-turn-helix domain-containing protein [Candidatus Paceibacterota bacterium]